MNKLASIWEGDPLPDFHSVERLVATEDVPIGSGTNTRRRYLVVLRDDRYWLSDAEKLVAGETPEKAE